MADLFRYSIHAYLAVFAPKTALHSSKRSRVFCFSAIFIVVDIKYRLDSSTPSGNPCVHEKSIADIKFKIGSCQVLVNNNHCRVRSTPSLSIARGRSHCIVLLCVSLPASGLCGGCRGEGSAPSKSLVFCS